MAIPLALIALGVKAATAYEQNQSSKRTAQRLEANRPYLPESTAALDQEKLAESELQGQSRNADLYYNNVNRNFANSLNTVLKNGGDVNDVGSLFDSSDEGYQRARMITENMRLNNIKNVVTAWQNRDNARQQQFQFNQWAPYADQAQANARARQQSANNLWGAVDGAVALGERYDASRNQFGNDQTYGGSGTSIAPAQVQNSWTVPSVAAKYNYIDPNSLNFGTKDTYSFES